MARKALQNDQIVKLIVGAGQAAPTPPVGPALGSKGVKSMDFCKVRLLQEPSPRTPPFPLLTAITLQEFNARTANYVPGTPIPARVTVRPDRSFSFEIRTPPTSSLLLAAAGAKVSRNKIRGAGNVPGPHNKLGLAGMGKGSLTGSGSSAAAGNAAMGTIGSVSLKHVYEIAKIKQSETRLSGMSLEGMVKSVVAQAGSLGVVVVP
ncbi:hypothetical protein MBLNU230_g2864t2 [Neophaeotheca triangularis]